MNHFSGKRKRESEGTLLTTLVVVGGAIVAGAAVFYGVAGLMKADVPQFPVEPFVLEVPEDLKDYTVPSLIDEQDIPEILPNSTPEQVPEPPAKTPAEKAPPEKAPKTDTETDTAEAAATQTGIVDKVVGELYVKPVDGKVQKAFSMGELVYSDTLGDYRVHNGVDISAPIGTKVRAMAGGEVTAIYFDQRLGSVLEITHSDKTVSKYCNLLAEMAGGVKVGSKVKMGDTVAGVGATSLSESAEATHIHIEVIKNGKHLNPENLFK